ncbi:MAG: sensor histidine kinase [Thomasclavelia sp.]|uniref:sensor histidine kinase n=1 Tax=Thomasclavelia sp. TaxID=3025757 RepID=UPI0039A1478F
MKRYNHLIVLSLIIYILLAFLSRSALLYIKDDNDRGYIVESNRIMNQINDKKQVNNFDLSEYEYIKNLEYLSYSITDQDILNDFYLESNTSNFQVLPFYQNNQLQGYIKLIYQIPELKINNILIIIEGSLLFLEIFILIVLIYLKKKLIQPFQRLNELPIELAKGNFNAEIKEEKSRYFGKFVWGMSQLKDTLDVSKRRQLELLKEKKKMLLSLSHDMKTPLNVIKLYSKALVEDIYQDQNSKLNAMKQINIKADEIEKYVDEIISSAREDILDLQVNNSEFYLTDLIERVLGIYQEQCDLRQITLIVHKYENRLLNGDIQRSQEIFENIFENAFKYGDGRKIEISFAEEDFCQLINIFSSGKPVTDTEFNHIFESFYRGANSKGQQGNGLGLYICRELMQKMDGAIFAQKSDEGMSFTLVFR